MPKPEPVPPAAVTLLAARHFMLTVQPQSVLQPWHARLTTEDGSGLDFDTPIDLLRHLAQLGASHPAPGRLK